MDSTKEDTESRTSNETHHISFPFLDTKFKFNHFRRSKFNKTDICIKHQYTTTPETLYYGFTPSKTFSGCAATVASAFSIGLQLLARSTNLYKKLTEGHYGFLIMSPIFTSGNRSPCSTSQHHSTNS